MEKSIRNRMTKQRGTVLEELKKLKSHPTADELYMIVREKLPRISLGTVYRNLDILSESGEIRRLDIGGGQWRFDGNTQKHYHVRCIECGRVGDIFGLQDGFPIEQVRKATDFEIITHQLEFKGICPNCKKKSNGDTQ